MHLRSSNYQLFIKWATPRWVPNAREGTLAPIIIAWIVLDCEFYVLRGKLVIFVVRANGVDASALVRLLAVH